MIYIQRVRSNDIGEDYGKQVELGKVFMSHHNWETGEIPVVLTFRALSESQMNLNGTKIKTSFKVRGDERGGDRIGVDCKEYANQDRICVLKRFLTEKLHLNPGEDYFILEDVGNDGRSFNLYGVHSSEIPATVLLDKFKGQVVDMDEPQETKTAKNAQPLQVIYYGAPGTGKSFTIDDMTDDENSVRTTFHPDSDYASFVGAYKPTMEDVPISATYQTKEGSYGEYLTKTEKHPGTERKIVYKYVPQAFLKAYVAAWSNLDTPYFLIIEEINRGNCAQIFGDLFQLLDRNSEGSSSYAIHADEDIAQFLSDDPKGFGQLSDEQKDAINSYVLHKDSGKSQMVGPDILAGKLLLLPPNLHIWATMNTSDQSLFPIDSAFKRRWNWEYVPIEYDKKEWYIQVGDKYYNWGDFIAAINPIIYDLTSSSDKQMGFFFVKPDKASDEKLSDNNIISEKLFINKVLFYLWTDVLKDYDVSEEPFLVKDSNPQRAYRFVDFFDKEHSYLQEFISKEKLGLKEVEIQVEVADMDGEQKVANGVNARVDGTKCWTITQTLYYTLRAIAPEYDYQQIKDLLKSHLNRDVDEVIKTIPEGYTKENRWLDFNPLQSADGQTFVITNQWKKDFIPSIKQLASDLGVEYIDYNDPAAAQAPNGQAHGDANGSRTLDRYSVNGQGNFLMGPAATEAMKIYIGNNPDRTAAEIVADWSVFNRPKVYTEEQYEAKKALSKDSRIDKKHTRFELANGEALYMSVGFIPLSMADFINILDTKDWNIEIRKIN